MNPRAEEALRRTLESAEQVRQRITIDPDELARYEDAVRRMPYLQRSIFLAVRLDDMSYAQVGERTGLSIAQVERQMRRALRNLRRNLADPRRGWWRRWWK